VPFLCSTFWAAYIRALIKVSTWTTHDVKRKDNNDADIQAVVIIKQ
jgi:hypothetical protein